MDGGCNARTMIAVLHRLANQEISSRSAGLVVIINHRVVGGLETVVFLGFAADGGEANSTSVFYGLVVPRISRKSNT